jgi:DNA repair exonuclease SbcCD ATPase subunit
MNEEEKKAIEYYQNKEVSFSVDFDTENLLKALGITEEDSFENHQIRFKTLLNLIEKLKKENEELKKDRNNNYRMIALAQNEALGYMQGYEDGKKSKRSAVAYIVENQQYYILNKQIEHYKEYIKKLQKENEEYSKQLDLDYVDKNYISKKKIEDTIEELKGKLDDISKRREKSKTKEEETVLWCLEIRTDERIKTLQELL